MRPIEQPKNEKSELEKLLGDEFKVKKYSVYVFLMTSLSYLIETLIKGKGSITLWVQIPTIFLYFLMAVLAKLYGDDMKY
jgi:hypothetical protein